MKTKRKRKAKWAKSWDRAHRRGQRDAYAGQRINPYPSGSYCAIEWNRGFQSVTQ